MVGPLDDQNSSSEIVIAKKQTLRRRMADGTLIVGFLTLSAIAIGAVAIATPVILVVSSLVGLLNKDAATNNWRPVSA